jgi:phosphopantothenate synthetase
MNSEAARKICTLFDSLTAGVKINLFYIEKQLRVKETEKVLEEKDCKFELEFCKKIKDGEYMKEEDESEDSDYY